MSQAGRLSRRIVIQRSIDLPNAYNELELGWGQLTEVWAQRMDVSDRERLSAGQVNAALTSRFRIRSSSITRGVTALDRIIHDGGIWEITGVKETLEGRKRFLEITASRQSDADEAPVIGEDDYALFVPLGSTKFTDANGSDFYVLAE